MRPQKSSSRNIRKESAISNNSNVQQNKLDQRSKYDRGGDKKLLQQSTLVQYFQDNTDAGLTVNDQVQCEGNECDSSICSLTSENSHIVAPCHTPTNQASSTVDDDDPTMTAQRLLPFCPEKHRKHLICLTGQQNNEKNFLMFSSHSNESRDHDDGPLVSPKSERKSPRIKDGSSKKKSLVLIQRGNIWEDSDPPGIAEEMRITTDDDRILPKQEKGEFIEMQEKMNYSLCTVDTSVTGEETVLPTDKICSNLKSSPTKDVTPKKAIPSVKHSPSETAAEDIMSECSHTPRVKEENLEIWLSKTTARENEPKLEQQVEEIGVLLLSDGDTEQVAPLKVEEIECTQGENEEDFQVVEIIVDDQDITPTVAQMKQAKDKSSKGQTKKRKSCRKTVTHGSQRKEVEEKNSALSLQADVPSAPSIEQLKCRSQCQDLLGNTEDRREGKRRTSSTPYSERKRKLVFYGSVSSDESNDEDFIVPDGKTSEEDDSDFAYRNSEVDESVVDDMEITSGAQRKRTRKESSTDPAKKRRKTETNGYLMKKTTSVITSPDAAPSRGAKKKNERKKSMLKFVEVAFEPRQTEQRKKATHAKENIGIKRESVTNITKCQPNQKFIADCRRIIELFHRNSHEMFPCSCGRVFNTRSECETHQSIQKLFHPQDSFHLVKEIDDSGNEKGVSSKLINLTSAETDKINNIRQPSFRCELCKKTFSRLSDSIAHVGRVHFNCPYILCEICESVLCDGNEYQKHITDFHPEKTTYPELVPCASCHMNFSSVDLYKDHLHQLHQDPFKCETCDYCCLSTSHLLEHKLCHFHSHGEFACQCPVCGKEFHQIALGGHVLSAHGQILPEDTADAVVGPQLEPNVALIKCGFCREFMTLDGLIKHRRLHSCKQVHHDNNSSREWTCHVCHMNFQNFHSWRLHATTRHSDEHSSSSKGRITQFCTAVVWPITHDEMILCEICGERMCKENGQDDYNQHLLGHNPIGQQTCKICFVTVPLKSLVRHMSLHARRRTTNNFPKSVHLFDSSVSFSADLRSTLDNLPASTLQHLCTTCGDLFESADMLQEHCRVTKEMLQHPQHVFHFITGRTEEGTEENVSSPLVFLQQSAEQKPHQKDMVSFKCQLCENSFSCLGDVVGHIGRVHYECIYMYCDLCGTVLMNHVTYSNHIVQFHQKVNIDVKKIIPCCHCPKNCESNNAVIDHIKECHAESNSICKKCGHVSVTKSEKLCHDFCHDPIEFVEHCPVCGKVMKYEELGSHVMEKHGKRHQLGNRPASVKLSSEKILLLQCSFCDKDNLTLKEMFEHRGGNLCPDVIKPINPNAFWLCRKCKKYMKKEEWRLHSILEHTDKCTVIDASVGIEHPSAPLQPALSENCSAAANGGRNQQVTEDNASPKNNQQQTSQSPSDSLTRTGVTYKFPAVWPGASSQCPICVKDLMQYKTGVSIKRHIRQVHLPKEFVCDQCGKVLYHEYSLVHHVNMLHNETREVCTIGGKRVIKSRLAYHMTKHKTDERKKECTYCGKQFVGSHLMKHIKRVHHRIQKTKMVTCPICPWLGPKGIYPIHLNMHTKEKTYPCPVCKKEFINPHVLSTHKKIHEEKRFVCDSCGKRFHQKCTLQRHMATHTGEKAYKCSWCPQNFAQSYPLSQHVKNKHPEEYAGFVEKDVRRMKRK